MENLYPRSSGLREALRDDLEKSAKKLTISRANLQNALDADQDLTKRGVLHAQGMGDLVFSCCIQDDEISTATLKAKDAAEHAEHTLQLKKPKCAKEDK